MNTPKPRHPGLVSLTPHTLWLTLDTAAREDILCPQAVVATLAGGDAQAAIALQDTSGNWLLAKKEYLTPENSWISTQCHKTLALGETPFVNETPGPQGLFFTGYPVFHEPSLPAGVLYFCTSSPHTFGAECEQRIAAMARLAGRLLSLHFRAAVNNSPEEILSRIDEGVICLDHDFRYTYANPKIGKITDRDPLSLLGKNVWEEFPDAVGSATWAAFLEAAQTRKYVRNIDYFAPLDLWQENHIYPSENGLSIFIRDVSEQKRAELALRQSHERFALVVEGSCDAIWDQDLVNDTIYFSPRLREWLDPNDLLETDYRKVFHRLVHPDDAQRVQTAIGQHLAGQAPLNYEVRLRTADQTYRWFQVRGQALWQDGKPVRIAGSISDINDKKAFKEKLIISENKMKSYFDNTNNIIILLDSNFKITYYNKHVLEIYKRFSGDAVKEGSDIRNGMPPHLVQQFSEDYASALAGNAADREVKIDVFSPPHWWHTVFAPIRDAAGTVSGVALTTENITARKNAEEALRNSEAMFRSLVQNAPGAVFQFIVPQDRSQSHFSFLSKRYAEIFGLPSDEASPPAPGSPFRQRMDWVTQIVAEDKDAFEQSMIKAVEQESDWEFIGRVHGGDGGVRWFHSRSIPVRRGEELVFNGIVFDITARKTLEQDNQRMIRELTRSNEDLRQFAYIATHNLRAPLTNLMSIVAMMDPSRIEDERTRHLVGAFSQSTRQLNEVLTDLISILMVRDKPQTAPETLNLEAALKQALAIVYSHSAAPAAAIEANFSQAPIIIFDASYLASILVNLLSNAIRYASPNRPLCLHLRSWQAENNVYLSVTDNGLGMNMEAIKGKIFGLHQRFHNRPDSRGLGLYLARTQLLSMGGDISVESTEDVGTTFTLSFPINTLPQ